MNQTLELTDIEAAGIAGLTVAAPPTLRVDVLVEVGLADHYARIDSPLGPLVVAWNGRGVSSVGQAGDDADFEARHLASTDRRAYPGTLPARLATAIKRRLDRATTHRHVKELPVGEVAQEEWDAHADDLAWRRELVGLLIERVIVKPSQTQHVRHHPHFGARFDPDSIDVVPRKLQAAP